MTKATIALVVAILAMVIAGVAMTDGAVFGGNTSYQKQSFVEGFYAGVGRVIEITRDGAVSLGSTLSVTGVATFTATPVLSTGVATLNGMTLKGVTDSSLEQSTTTVCALQSPSATSTLLSGGINITLASTSAVRVTVAKAANAFATTTVLGAGILAGSSKGTVTATTTGSADADGIDASNLIFGPNQYLVVGFADGIGTYTPSGSCSALWATI